MLMPLEIAQPLVKSKLAFRGNLVANQLQHDRTRRYQKPPVGADYLYTSPFFYHNARLSNRIELHKKLDKEIGQPSYISYRCITYGSDGSITQHVLYKLGEDQVNIPFEVVGACKANNKSVFDCLLLCGRT